MALLGRFEDVALFRAWTALVVLLAGSVSSSACRTDEPSPGAPPTTSAARSPSVIPAAPSVVLNEPNAASNEPSTDARKPSPSQPRTMPTVILAQLTQQHARLKSVTPEQYPSADSPEFVHSVSWDELGPLRGRKAPTMQRFGTLMSLLEQTQALMKMYSNRDTLIGKSDPSKLKDSTEALHYVRAQLHVSAVLFPIALDELMPSLPPQHPQAEAARGGLEQMRSGLVGTVQGVLTTIHARRSPLSDRRELSEALSFHSDVFGRSLRTPQVVQIHGWLAEALKKETDATIRTNLERAKKGFNAALRLLPSVLR
jgi:hypothetical protein